MSKIEQLFNEDFVKNFLTEKALPFYKKYKAINRVSITYYKKMVWEDRYHVVLEFITTFIDQDNKEVEVSIFCSAHDSEPRINVYSALKYLWKNNFPDENIKIPKPLFFSQEFNGIFYEGLRGDNLYQYIKREDLDVVRKMIIQSAKLFAKLHSLPSSEKANFNPLNSRIKTTIPGVQAIYQKIIEHYGKDNKYSVDLQKMYDSFISKEEQFMAQGRKLSIIHGDAHSENIIRIGDNTIGLIDFTDLCLGDFARDLGTFLQQFEYKMTIKVSKHEVTQELKELFLDTYSQVRKIKLDDSLKERIDLYYNWTAIRSAIYLFLKYDNDPSGGEALFNAIKHKLRF